MGYAVPFHLNVISLHRFAKLPERRNTPAITQFSLACVAPSSSTRLATRIGKRSLFASSSRHHLDGACAITFVASPVSISSKASQSSPSVIVNSVALIATETS
jgi:hypothetical protein